jgi:hypothetical protein
MTAPNAGAPISSPVRFKMHPLDVPPTKAARRLGLSLAQFRQKLRQLLDRGFPPADPTTGNYYLPAIDQWMASRIGLTAANGSQNHQDTILERIARL